MKFVNPESVVRNLECALLDTSQSSDANLEASRRYFYVYTAEHDFPNMKHTVMVLMMLMMLSGVRFLQTFLKPLYFEVPVSFPVTQFTGTNTAGRTCLGYRDIFDGLA